MTNLEAIAAEIEPYSLSDDSIEKSFVDACAHFDVEASAEDEYSKEMRVTCVYGALLCLNRLRALVSENIGGISQTYDVKRIEALMRSLAKSAGLSPDLFLDDADNSITFIQM